MFVVMPFGLSNAPMTFQPTMNDLFRPYLQKFVLVFFDDILIYRRTWEEHLQQLKIVLQLLCNQQFTVNQKKSSFGRIRVEYIGYVISYQGVAMDPAKVSSVLNWPIPKILKGVKVAMLGKILIQYKPSYSCWNDSI